MSNDISVFREYLSNIDEKKIFIDWLEGNNGDKLISLGLEFLLKECNIKIVENPNDADIILLNGGGAMNDLWPSGAAQVLEKYISNCPDKKFIVAPSSYFFTELEFSKIVNKCNDIVLFCREEISYSILSQLEFSNKVKILLSDDLAFELKNSPFLETHTKEILEKHILIVMRKDREGASNITIKIKTSWIPKPIRKMLSTMRDKFTANASKEIYEKILKEEGKLNCQKIFRDISVSVSFEDFCNYIKDSKLIITDRLHVCIFGALLGKRVKLIKGKYHKSEGVYLRNFKKNVNIELV